MNSERYSEKRVFVFHFFLLNLENASRLNTGCRVDSECGIVNSERYSDKRVFEGIFASQKLFK